MIPKDWIKKTILSILKKENGNIHITKLTNILKRKDPSVSKPTVSKYCYILQAEGKIKIVPVGNIKMVRLT